MPKGITDAEYKKWMGEDLARQIRELKKYEREHVPKKAKRQAGKIAQKRANIQARLRQARTDRRISDGWAKIPVFDGIPLEEWKEIAKHGKTKQERNEAQARINAYRIQEQICAFWVHNISKDMEPSGKALDLTDLDPNET